MTFFFIMLMAVVAYGIADIVWSSVLAEKSLALDERERKLKELEDIVKERFLAVARMEEELKNKDNDKGGR